MNHSCAARLNKFGIPAETLKRYDEPHRFYHTAKHIHSMLDMAAEMGILSDDLFLAIIFHDIIYDPKGDMNEELSVEHLQHWVQNDAVNQAILDTKTHNATSELSEQLIKLDLSVLYDTFEKFVDYEEKIFKEYQWVDYSSYKERRIEILKNYQVNPDWIEYVRLRKPNIAVYPGSFNPFHRGHMNILQKAEKIFDKVIIGKGQNPEKDASDSIPLPDAIQFRQCEHYGGLLTTFMNGFDYDVTLIRGLRNASDLQYELTQYRILQDLKPDIKIVSIFCDKEYEHISSTAVRQLKKYMRTTNYDV